MKKVNHRKILFVGSGNSIHLARWINSIDRKWEIHLFTLNQEEVHSDLSQIIIHGGRQFYYPDKVNIYSGIAIYSKRFYHFLYNRSLISKIFLKLFYKILALDHKNLEEQLQRTIKDVSPDIVHSLETQKAGYLVLSVFKKMTHFPIWAHSNYGSDLFLYQFLDEHTPKIEELLKKVNFLFNESQRDLNLAVTLGYSGPTMPVIPNCGGFDLDKIRHIYTKSIEPSERTLIMIKGYQHWAGRALFALAAIEKCVDLIKDKYTIAIYSPSDDVWLAARIMSKKFSIKITQITETSNIAMLEYHSKARLSIGLSISDGISISFLEAAIMGSFPIQSNTSTANEWCIDGITCFLVEPLDISGLANRIRIALTDDNLVNNAAEMNYKKLSQQLDNKIVSAEINCAYDEIIKIGGSQC